MVKFDVRHVICTSKITSHIQTSKYYQLHACIRSVIFPIHSVCLKERWQSAAVFMIVHCTASYHITKPITFHPGVPHSFTYSSVLVHWHLAPLTTFANPNPNPNSNPNPKTNSGELTDKYLFVIRQLTWIHSLTCLHNSDAQDMKVPVAYTICMKWEAYTIFEHLKNIFKTVTRKNASFVSSTDTCNFNDALRSFPSFHFRQTKLPW